MRRKLFFIGITIAASTGCGGGKSAVDNDMTPTNDMTAVSDLGTGTFTFDEQLFDQFGGDGGRTPIAGATACIAQHAEVACATSDGTGAVTLTTTPALAENATGLSFSYTAPGYLGRTQHFMPASLSPASTGVIFSPVYLLSTAEAQALFASFGVAYPQSGTGYLVGSAGASGIQVNAGGGKTTYLNAMGNPVAGATQTVASGNFVVAGMVPGAYSLLFTSVNADVHCIYEETEGPDFDVPYMPSLNQANGYVAADSIVLAQNFACQVQ